MHHSIDPSRRRFLIQAGTGLVGWAGLPKWLRAMESGGMGTMPKPKPNEASASFNPDVEVELVCRPSSISILDGPETQVWRYFANLTRGRNIR